MGHILPKPLPIRNIYHPPRDNNGNDNISAFLSESSPVLDILRKEDIYAVVVGDVNIRFYLI